MIYTINFEGTRFFTVSVRKEEEGGYSAQCLTPGHSGAISQAETLEDLFVNMADAISLING